MLYASHDFIVAVQLVLQIGTLVSVYHCLCDSSTQKRIFSRALADTSPTWVATDVYHRTECPGNAVGTCFDGCNTGGFLDSRHIPGAGQSQWNGEDGFVAMYHIHAEQQGNAEA